MFTIYHISYLWNSENSCVSFSRCVPDNKRAFASGIKYLFFKALGLLPGPIVFGHIVDSYCTVWQDTCGVRGRCFHYDIDSLSNASCVFGVILTCKYRICSMDKCGYTH